MPRFTTIKLDDLDKVRRMPRLGKVRLGVKVKGKGGSEYPKEVDYFVLPPEVLKKLGISDPTSVKELDIMVASEDLEEVFPQRLAAYKQSGLFCEGDGTQAVRRDKGTWVDHKCPCPMLESGDCKKDATLNIVLPSFSLGGCFQIVTSSWNSIVDVNSGLDHVRKMIGRISWVPLKLVREPTKTSHYDEKTQKTHKQTHWTIKVIFPYDLDFVNRLKMETERIMSGPTYRLPAPLDNPYDDPVDLVEEEDGTLKPVGSLPAPAPEAVDAERMAPGEPTPPTKPARPAKAAAAPKPAPAPKSPPAPKPAPAPTPPPPAPVETGDGPPATMATEHTKELWRVVQLAFRDADRAKGFFKFFVEVCVGVATSTDVPYDWYAMYHSELVRMSEIADDQQRTTELVAFVDQLKKNARERIAKTKQAAGSA